MTTLLRKSWGRFLKRRSSILLSTIAVVVGSSLLAIWLWPATYLARATVAPAGSEYTGPTHRLIARVSSQANLETLAAEAGLVSAADLGFAARLVLPAEPAARITPADQPLVTLSPGDGKVRELVITTRATSRAAATAAANRIAVQLVEFDAQLRGARPASTPQDAPLLPQHRLALTKLQQRYPLLANRSRLQAHRLTAARVAKAQSEVAALAAQLRGYETKSKRLWALVEEEAREAWAHHRAQEARRAAAKRAVAAAPAPTPAAPAPVAGELTVLQQLEEELQRLLAKLTERHPDVRRVRRLLTAERQRLQSVKESEPPKTEEPPPAEPEPAAAPVVPGAIADDPAPAELPPEAEEELPNRFLHGARSYPDWLAARNQVDDTRAQLQARQEQLTPLAAAHDAEQKELAVLLKGLPEAEREQARLQSLIAAGSHNQSSDPSRGAPTPLLPGDAARIVASFRPSRFLPGMILLSLALALLLALVAEVQDPSLHSGAELTDLGVPVLGVIPHLRGRR